MKANTTKKPAQKSKGEQIALGKLINAHNALEKNANDKLPIRLSLKIFKFRKAVEVSEEFYRTKLQEIVAKYGLKNPDGETKLDEKGNPLIDTERISDCRTAITELESCMVDKPDFIFEVDELEEIRFSVNDIAFLEDFISKEA